MYFERQLDLPSGIPGVGYFSELRRAQRHTRIAKTRVIERVEKLAAQLHVAGVLEAPSFIYRKIHVVESIGAQDVAAGIAEGVLWRLRESRGVEPTLRRAVGDCVGVTYDVRILRGPAGNGTDVGDIRGQERHERQAAVVREDAGDVPIRQHGIDRAVLRPAGQGV